MISTLNDYTVEDFLSIYDIHLQDALQKYGRYYVEDGLIKVSKDAILDIKVTSQ